MELESRDDRGVNASGTSANTGLIDISGVSIIGNNPAISPNQIGTDILDIKEDTHSVGTNITAAIPRDLVAGSSTRSNNHCHSHSVPAHVFDAATQQLIDSMKYTDLTLSVESPGITTPVEIPCHKFMLAKKVTNQLMRCILFRE